MTRYRFELAAAAVDADLRRVLADTPMEGSIALSFRREPSYFDAAVVEGRFRQVVAARDSDSGHIVGFGSRAIAPRYVNGVPAQIGYLSSLRLLREHRSFGLVARGYRYFRELHDDCRTQLYLTTIAIENRSAMSLLTSGRAGLPNYRPAGEYHSIAIPLRTTRSGDNRPYGIELRNAENADLGEVLHFLNDEGPRRQFFPQYQAADFSASDGILRGLRLTDLLLAERNGQIVGLAGYWDQRAFRQTVVAGYRGTTRFLRPLYNRIAPLFNRPPLPEPGNALRSAYVALPLVKEDDPAIFGSLLNELVWRASKRDLDYLILGLHDRDPLLHAVKRFGGRWYTTRLFLVTWHEDRSAADALDDRPPYLELGCL